MRDSFLLLLSHPPRRTLPLLIPARDAITHCPHYGLPRRNAHQAGQQALPQGAQPLLARDGGQRVQEAAVMGAGPPGRAAVLALGLELRAVVVVSVSGRRWRGACDVRERGRSFHARKK